MKPIGKQSQAPFKCIEDKSPSDPADTKYVVCDSSGGDPCDPNDPDYDPTQCGFGGDIVIKDKIDGTDGAIYTMLTATTKQIIVDNKQNPGNISNVSCSFKSADIGTATTTGNNEVTIEPHKSGRHTLTCSGTIKDINGKPGVATTSADFYSAPTSYTINGLWINIPSESTQPYPDSIVEPKTQQWVNYGAAPVELKLKPTTPPIIKMGSTTLILANAQAQEAANQIDKGINGFFENPNNGFSLLNDTAGCSSSNVIDKHIPTGALQPRFNQGIMAGGAIASFEYTTDLPKLATLNIVFRDAEVYSEIESEAGRGMCDNTSTFMGKAKRFLKGIVARNGKIPCPFPPSFKLKDFKFKVAPYDFLLKVTKSNDDPIKVLYYGQGTNPAAEEPTKLTLQALDMANKPLQNFIDGCAADNMRVELDNNGTSLPLLDKTGKENNIVLGSEFKPVSEAITNKILKINPPKQCPQPPAECFNPSEVYEPSFTKNNINSKITFEVAPNYPIYTPKPQGLDDAVILRGRINVIDAYNTDGQGKTNGMPVTKVYHEFYCKVCNLSEVLKITDWENKYPNRAYQNSPTIYGWYIDDSFANYNAQKIDTKNIDTTNGLKVSGIGAIPKMGQPNAGIETINYSQINNGKYQVKIRQKFGLFADDYPVYLLYAPYYDGNASDIGTSANVYVNDELKDEDRDFGVDSGAAKNTKGSSRTGGF